MNVFSSIWNFLVAGLNYLLQFFYDFTGNYGVSIILLTVLVKLVLLPLTIKQTRSMLAMQRIQPEIKKLQEKHKDDKEKLSQEMMKFYKENKINPLSGCLPLLMQMPIFIALYTVLRKYVMTPPIMLLGSVVQKNVTPYGASLIVVQGSLIRNTSFLGIENLSDSLRAAGIAGYVLIVLLMASTWYSQKQVMTDPRQKGMMYAMPLVMGFIGFSLPAGVVLYWVTTNILQIVQQYGIQWWEKKEMAKNEEEAARLKAEMKKSGKKPEKEEKPASLAEKEETPRALPGKKKEPGGKPEKSSTVPQKAGKTSAPGGGKQGGKPSGAKTQQGGKQGGKPLPKQPPAGRRKPPPKKK
jgi:YidC/Oxa1 family membrane protein insertase